jgi:hypothetical protein
MARSAGPEVPEAAGRGELFCFTYQFHFALLSLVLIIVPMIPTRRISLYTTTFT